MAELLEDRSLLSHFEILSSSLGAGPVMAPTQVTLDFSLAVDLATVQASDVTFGGLPATGFTVVDADTLTFQLQPVGSGTHTLAIALGAIGEVGGTTINAFSSQTTVDATAPRVISSSVLEGAVLNGTQQVEWLLTFDEPMGGGTNSPVAYRLKTSSGAAIPPISVVPTGLQSTRAFFPGVGHGNFTLEANFSGAIRDAVGNLLDGEAHPSATVPTGDGTAGGSFQVNFSTTFDVTGTTPASNGVVPVAPFSYVVDFNSSFDVATVQAGDLLIDGQPLATSVTVVDANTVSFALPALAVGSHQATIAGGAIVSSLGVGVTNFARSFTVDSTGPKVIASSILEGGSVSSSSVTYTATFDRNMASAGFTTGTVLLAGQATGAIAASSVSYNAGTRTLTANFTGLPVDQYTLTLVSGAAAIRDSQGLPLDGEANAGTTVPSGDGAGGGNFVVHFSRAMTVTSTNPASGAIVASNLPFDFTVDFDAAYDPATVQASDLLIDGNAIATSVTQVDADTLRFTIPALANGSHTASLPVGAIGSAAGPGLAAFNTGFTSASAPRVIASSLVEDQSTTSTLLTYTATFDQPLTTSDLTSADVTLVGQLSGVRSVTSFSYNTSTRTITASLSLASTPDVYTLTLLSSSTGFRGTSGLLLDGERQSATTVPSGDGTPGGNFVVRFFKALTVLSTSPFNGASISGPLPTFDVNFNGAIDAATVQAGDLLIDGAPLATAVTVVDSDTIRFSLPTLTDGLHQITLPAGALASTAGVLLTAYSGTLTTNSVGPRVVASSILEGALVPDGNITYTATFSEALNSGVLSGADVTLVGLVSGVRPSPTFSYNASTFTITATFANPPSDQYTLTLLSNSNGFTDSAGNLLDGERHPSNTVPTGDGNAGGDFVLHFGKAFAVSSTAPAAGGTLLGGSAYEVNFNGNVDPASVQADDLLIDGVPAIGVTIVDADTVRFSFDPGADGTHTATIAAGAITSAANLPLGAFSQTFVSNANGPHVTSSSIADGDVLPVGAVVYQANFSEAVDGSVLNFADLSLTTSAGGLINPNVFSLLPNSSQPTSVSASFVILTDDIYTLRLNSGTNGFRDLGGAPLDGSPSFPLPSGDGVAGGDFQVTFVVDNGTTPVPINLTAKNPLGGLIHAGTASSTIGFEGDTDLFTLSLDAGQAISVMVDPVDGLSTQVELMGPSGNTVASASSSTAGAHAIVLDAPVVAGGTYTLRVTGLGGTGRFEMDVLLNALPELEEQGGAGNDTPGAAQAIGFLDLSSMERAAIVGALPTITQTVASDSFTTSTLGSQWTTNAVGGTGRVQVTGSFTTASGPFAMWMDTASLLDVTNEAIWNVDLTGLTQATLRFSHAEWNDGETSLPAIFSGSAIGDGVSISADGLTWHTVFNATNLSNGSWQQVTIDLDAAAAAAGIALGPNFKIKFQQYGFSSLFNDGRGYDEITITTPTFMEDWYEFTLTDGQFASIALAGLDGAGLELELYDAAGNLLSRGREAGTIERAIQAFRDATSDGDIDTYRVRVAGPGGGEYSLVVTRDGGFEPGGNNTAQTAQPLNGAVLGYAQLPALGRLFGHNGSTMYEINPVTGALIRSFPSPAFLYSGFGLATTGSSLLAASSPFDAIYELNPDSGAIIRTIPNPGIEVVGMAFQNNEIFLTSTVTFPGSSPAQITVLDYPTGAIKRTFTTVPLSGHLASDGTHLIGWANNSVQRIDPVTGAATVIGALSSSTGFTGMGVIGNELFVGLSFSSSMLVFSLDPVAQVRTLPSVSVNALGADGGASSGYHRFLANAGDNLVIRTNTPGGGTFAPVNTLDPAITLIRPDGSTVAHTNITGNELLSHTATMTGTYTVRVQPQATAGGEYVLTVTGNTGASLFAVASSYPADGGVHMTPPTTVAIDLNHELRLDSVQASDLTLDGVPASEVIIQDQDTLLFTVAAPSDGQHVINIAGGALTSLDGRPIAAFSSNFTQDTVAPRVIASSILQNDTASPGTLIYTAQFSEALNTSNLDVGDVTITRGGVTLGAASISYDAAASTLTATFFDVIEGDYTLRLASGSTALRDLAGLSLDGERHATTTVPSGNGSAGGDFTVAFKVEATSPVPLAFAVVEPAGARVYEGVATGTLAAAGDVDVYEFSLDAGQTLALIVEVAGGAQVALELHDSAGQLIRQATAAAGGADVLMQGETLAAGLYRLHVIGAAGAAPTSYRLRALLNADVESERFPAGSDNGSTATAVDLASAMIPLTANAAIASVLGRGDQNRNTMTIAGTLFFPNVLTLTFDNLPAATADGTIDITATGDIEAGNETILVNIEGMVTQTIFTTAGTSTRTASIPVTQAQWNTLLADGRLTVTLTPSALVSSFTGNTATVTVNHTPGAVAGDMYRVALAQGESLSASVKARGTGAVTSFQLFDLDGVTVKAVGAAAVNSDGAIVDFLAPAAGDYFLRVMADGEYLLTATRAAVLDAEFAGAPADLTSAGVAAGHVSSRNLGRLFGVDILGSSPGIREYQPATGALIASLPLPFSPVGSQLGLATTAATLLVASSSHTNIFEIDPATGQTLRTIPLGKNVYALAYLDGEIYAQTGSNLIDVIDHASGQVTRQVMPTSSLHLGALAAARGRLLAVSSGGGSLLTISPRTGETTVVNTPLSLTPGGMAVVGEELFLPASSTSMRVYDLDSFALKRTMTIAGSSIVALGGDGELADEDLYALQVNVGDVLTIATSTPADGPEEFANALDPRLELRHATLGLIAADDNSGADGRNAIIAHTATVAGTYFVRVIAAGATGGEYTLTALGATGGRLPLQVASITPADGSFSATAITQITVAFDDSFDVTTVDAGDLTVNGVAATAVSILSGRAAQFTIASPGQGTHTVSLAGIVDVQGTAMTPFQSQYTVDTTAPRVTGISVQQNGSIPTGDATITVQFSEVIAPLTSGDFTLFGSSTGSKAAQSFAFDPATRTLSLQYTGLTEQNYTLTLLSADGAFEDLAGNNLDGEAAFPMPPNQSGNGTAGGNFVVNFHADRGLVAFPSLNLNSPPATIARGQATAFLGAGDTDSWSINLDANQVISIQTSAVASQRYSLTLRDPQGAIVATGTSSVAGKAAFIQAAPVVEAGVYTIDLAVVSGAGGSLTVTVDLNAAIEQEPITGATNNTAATAQNIDAAFISLGLAGATRTAVTGSSASSPDFYAFTLNAGQRMSLYGLGVSALRLTDAAGTTLATAASLNNGGRGLFDFVATVGGTYYASATPSSDPYWVMVTRDAATSFHNQFAETTPIDVTVSRTILGNFTNTSTQHLYNVQVQAGDEIVVTTATPGDGGGEFVNTLDPMIELRDPAGLLATDDDNELPDGRNASLTHVAQTSGVYQVRLKSAFGAGAYVLDVDVNPGAGSTFTAAASITDGALVASAGSTVQINFSQSVDFTTLAAGDVLLDGVALTGMTVVDRDSATFAWSPAAGPHVLSIAAGAVTDHLGRSLAAFNSTFTLDNVAPRIIGATFASGPTVADPMVITIDFNETMASSVTNSSSVTLLHIASNQTLTPSSNTYDAATSRWQMQRVGEQGRYRLTLVSGNSRLEDLAGNDLDGDLTATPLPPNQSGNGTAGGNFIIEFDHLVGAFAVESTNITQGLANAPFIVNFNRPVDAATLAAGDLTIDGVPAVAVTLIDANTASFTLPALPDGPHTAAIAAGDVADYLGNPIEAFAAPFTLDLTGPRIVAVSMQADQIIGSTSPAPITVRFDEAVNAAVLTADDLLVTTSAGSTVATTFAYDPATFTGTITLPSSLAEGRYTLRVKSHAQAVKDVAGNLLDGESPAGAVPPAISGDGVAGGDFVLSFVVDKTGATALPFAALSPLTSLASMASATAQFVTAADADRFTLDILGGQAVTVVVDPQDASPVLKIELFDPADNLVGQAMATGAGETVMLVSAPAAAAGVYTIAVTQTAAGEGRYNVTALLNAAAELESNGGGGNDDVATAQDLNAAFTEIAGVNRAAVVGALEGPPFYTQTNRAAPLPLGTTYLLTFTGTPTPEIGATLTIKAFGDLSGTDEFLNITIAGVTRQVFVNDGSDTQEVTAVIPLTQAEVLAARSGTNFSVYFAASSGVGSVPNSYAELTLTYDQNPGVGDLYRVDLAAGERLDLAATMTLNAGLSSLHIQNAAGVQLHSASGVSPHLRGFVAPTAGDYYVRLSGPTSAYTLVATRGAALAVEGKEPVDLTAVSKALGDLGSPDAADSYTVNAVAGDVLVIETDVPLVGPGSRVYFADPMLELLDPTGQVVATDLDGTGDGRDARITHTAAMTGRYTVRVSHENDGVSPGLDARFYDVGAVLALPVTDGLTPVLVRVDPDINYPPVSPDGFFANTGLTNFFAANWSGKIVTETAGTYAFTLGSDDGSRLTIDGIVVVNNDGPHPYREISGAIHLAPGFHDIRVEMFDLTGAAGAILYWQQPTQLLREVVPARVLLHGDPAAGVSVTGAYALSITGASAPPVLRVRSVTPAETSVPSLSQITVQFSESVSPASILPSDLTIDGNPAAAVTVNDDTAVFTLAAPASPGVHALAIAAGAVSDPAGNLLEAYASSVTVDPVAPRVIATSVAANSTIVSNSTGSFSVDFQFDEPINFAALNPADVLVSGTSNGSPTKAVTYNDATRTMTVALTGYIDTRLTLTLRSTNGGVRDLAGNLLDGDANGSAGGDFNLTFMVDADTITTRGSQSGGTINYATANLFVSAGIASNDTDTFLVNLDAGQVAWFAVDGGASTTATVQMFTPGGALIAIATATTVGGIAELPAQTIAEAGEYRFVVTGAVTGSGDTYTFYKLFNGLNDLDSLDTRTSAARNIDALFVPLGGDAAFAWVQRQINPFTTGNHVYSMTLAAGDVLSVLYDPSSSSSIARVMDPTGTTLRQDASTGSLANRQIRNYTVPSDGVYLVRFEQTNSFDALFGVNLGLRTEAATSDTAALSINATGNVLGSITSSTQVDRHRFTLAAGDVIEVATQTPFDGPFELLNTLNPRLELVDPAGNVVATNLNGAADGRNARIVATALAGGDYLIRIAAESGTGAYLLAAEIIGTSVAPTDITLSSQAIAENQPAGTLVGTFATIDADAGESFTYALVAGEGDADNAFFNVVGDQLVAAASFDFETRGSYAVRVRSTDHAGLFVEKQFTVAVTDVNEDVTPPVVERVSVNGGWHANFYAHLGESGIGGAWGYALPEGAEQFRPLSWTGITQIAIHFSEHVDVAPTDLTVLGVNVADYASRLAPGGFSYDSNTFIASWTFTAPLTADKLRLLLDDRVADAAGNALDGEWTDLASAASGDGAAGGDFSYRLNILPGDGDATLAGRVQSSDVIAVRNAQFTRPGIAGYSVFLDVDATGNVSSSDVIKARNLQFTRLPDGEPPMSPPMQGGSQQLLASNFSAAPLPAASDAPATGPALDAFSAESGDPPALNTSEAADVPQSLSAPSVLANQLAAPSLFVAELVAAAQPSAAPARPVASRKPWEPPALESSVFESDGAGDRADESLPSFASPFASRRFLPRLPAVLSFRIRRG